MFFPPPLFPPPTPPRPVCSGSLNPCLYHLWSYLQLLCILLWAFLTSSTLLLTATGSLVLTSSSASRGTRMVGSCPIRGSQALRDPITPISNSQTLKRKEDYLETDWMFYPLRWGFGDVQTAAWVHLSVSPKVKFTAKVRLHIRAKKILQFSCNSVKGLAPHIEQLALNSPCPKHISSPIIQNEVKKGTALKLNKWDLYCFIYAWLIANNFIRLYLFIFRERRREEERERNINVWLSLAHPSLGTWPTTQACALTGNQTGDPLPCSPVHNPLSHTSQGSQLIILNENHKICICICVYMCGYIYMHT